MYTRNMKYDMYVVCITVRSFLYLFIYFYLFILYIYIVIEKHTLVQCKLVSNKVLLCPSTLL